MENNDAKTNNFKPDINYYNKFRKSIINMLSFRYKLDKYTAEDVFQDTFINYAKSLSKLQAGYDERGVVNWIFKACTNNYKKHFRFNNRHKSKYIDKLSSISVTDLLKSFDSNKLLHVQSNILTKYVTYVETSEVEDNFVLGLNKIERKIYFLTKEGYTLDEICKKFNPRKSYAVISKHFNNLKKYVHK